MKTQSRKRVSRGTDSSTKRGRVHRLWRRLAAAAAVPTLLACADAPLGPVATDLDRIDDTVTEVVDPVPLEGTDRGDWGPPFRRPEGSEIY